MSIVAPTLGDAVTSCANGPSGLRVHDPTMKVSVTPGGTIVKFSNGVEAKIFGAHTPEDVERLRSGGNRCFAWCEEMAAWRYMDEAWQHMRYGLRIGPEPRAVISTTPKGRKLIRDIVKMCKDPENSQYVLTHATTDDNPYLQEHIRNMLFEDYGGTRLGRQELYGEVLEDVEGALWNDTMVEPHRVHPRNQPDHYDVVVVGVDPSLTEAGDECGIIVASKVNRHWMTEKNEFDTLPNGFILADYSAQAHPEKWARIAIKAYHDHEANYIVAEQNNGGELVKVNLHAVDPTVPVKLVHASRGKTKRAEPIATKYEQGRIHHVGTFGHLEDEMYTWDAYDEDPSWSPNRMDAMVWALSELLLGVPASFQTVYQDNRLRGRR
jgi:phage terminase large subunit-like protein